MPHCSNERSACLVLANHHLLKVMSTKVVSREHQKGSTPAILPAHVCNCLELSKSSSHSGNGVAAIVALLTSVHLWCNLQMPCRHWGPEAGTIHARQALLTFAAAQAQRECASLLLMLLEGTNDGQKNHQHGAGDNCLGEGSAWHLKWPTWHGSLASSRGWFCCSVARSHAGVALPAFCSRDDLILAYFVQG